MIWSVIKWFLVMLLYSVFYGSVTVVLLILKIFFPISWVVILISPILSSWVMFPLVWIFRKPIIKHKILPFYLYIDLTEFDIYGDPKWLEERGLERTFLTAYKWNIRNIGWGFWNYFRVKSGIRELIKVVDETNYTGWREDVYLPCQIKTNEGNFGDTFSSEKSILGFRFIIYKVGKTVFWNWSKAFEKKDGIFVEWELGYNDKRYVLNRNEKKLKK